jgi:hypothetical protein
MGQEQWPLARSLYQERSQDPRQRSATLNTREYNALHENALGKKEDHDRQDHGDERPRLEQIGLLTV